MVIWTPVLKAADRSRLDSVQNFLNSDTSAGMVDTNQDGIIDGRDESVNMTRYLTGGRSPAIPPSMYYGFQDGGEQFGKVIQQASVPEPYAPDNYDEWRPRDKRATNIAANFMFGYQDGLDIQHYQKRPDRRPRRVLATVILVCARGLASSWRHILRGSPHRWVMVACQRLV